MQATFKNRASARGGRQCDVEISAGFIPLGEADNAVEACGNTYRPGLFRRPSLSDSFAVGGGACRSSVFIP